MLDECIRVPLHVACFTLGDSWALFPDTVRLLWLVRQCWTLGKGGGERLTSAPASEKRGTRHVYRSCKVGRLGLVRAFSREAALKLGSVRTSGMYISI